MSNSETAYYLYCLTPGGCGIPSSGAGVDGQHPVSVRDCGGIGAVLSEVELAEFCGETAEARLQDLAWLGPRVCRHESVIEERMRRAPVLPARWATLFTSFEGLQQSVLARREPITGFFAQLGDQQEWAVKGLLDRGSALRGLGLSLQAAAQAGCPKFGASTVLNRPPDQAEEVSVRPGLHSPKAGGHQVVWFDPAVLGLHVAQTDGVENEDVLKGTPEQAAEGLRLYRSGERRV